MTPAPDPQSDARHAIALIRALAISRAFRPGEPIVLAEGEVALLEGLATAWVAGREDRETASQQKGGDPR